MNGRKTMWTVMLAAALAVAMPLAAAAQSSLATSEATAFVGAWELGLDTPQGAATLDLQIKDSGGKVAATIAMPPMMPDPQNITDIAKDNGALVLKYSLDMQGMAIPAKITITPDGGGYKASFDFADGQFVMDGTAKKK